MIGAFGGINEEAIHPLQSGFKLLRCRELTIWHQIEIDQSVIQNWRELMQVFMGFRPRHRKLRAEYIEGRICLVVIEDELQFLRQRWQFAFGATARVTPARAGCDPCFIRVLLGCPVDITEDGQ